MDISIKILSSEEFDNLSESETRGAYVGDSLGFADTVNRRIYVRDTGIDELNHYTLEHEVEHLFSDERGHDDPLVPGIRHKKFFKELFLPLVTGGLISGGTRGKTEDAKRAEEAQKVQEGRFQQAQLFGNPTLSPQGGGQQVPSVGLNDRQSPLGAGLGGASISPFGSPFGGGDVAGLPLTQSLKERLAGFFSGRVPF